MSENSSANNNSSQQPSGRNRRSLKNLFVAPGNQIRLSVGLPVLGLGGQCLLLVLLRSTLLTRIEQLRETVPAAEATAQDLERVISFIFVVCLGLSGTCIIMMAAVGLLISHRYYGPQVPIMRSLKEFKDGIYKGRILLRRGDELKEVAVLVNELGEALESRHGSLPLE